MLLASVAQAHSILSRAAPDAVDLSQLLGVGLPMALVTVLYGRGLARLWTRGMRSHAELLWRTFAFAAGLVTLGVALLSPLDGWGSELFALHMIQHEVLMLLAAPLLVLGRPLPLFLWAFSERGRSGLSAFLRANVVRRGWDWLLSASTAWLLHALALWIWHVPRFFDAVLQSEFVHDLQHISFLVSALLFWAALFHERRRERQGAAVLYLFTTTVHTSVLGALITFASHPWYSAYLQTSADWGLTALEDQQLGGLIMWVPGSLVYVGTALVLMGRWIVASDRTSTAS